MKRCEELVGKVVADFLLYEDAPYGPEIQIEFADGTIFNSCLKTTSTLEAKLLHKNHDEAEHLKDL